MWNWIKRLFVKEVQAVETVAETALTIIEAKAGVVETVIDGSIRGYVTLTDEWMRDSQQTRYNHILLYLDQNKDDNSENASIVRAGLSKELAVLKAQLGIN